MIAQEAATVEPDAVTYFSAKLRPLDDEETDLLGVEPMAFVAHLILAVQQLSARIQELEGRLHA